ncbi:MAG: S8 family peptidase [Alphaproteobacteria bacterium]
MIKKIIFAVFMLFPLVSNAKENIKNLPLNNNSLELSSDWAERYVVEENFAIAPYPYVIYTSPVTVGGTAVAAGSIFTPLVVTVVAGAAIAGVAVAAGSGGSSKSSTTTSSSNDDNTVYSEDHYETTEYNNQYALASVNASGAYARNYNGSGVNVAIFDGWVDTDHTDLAANVSGCYDPATGSTTCSGLTADNHGTHVAGIIGAAKNDSGMHGVAYNANLYSLNLDSATTTTLEANAINYAINNFNADIINNSYCWLGNDSNCLASNTAEAITKASTLKNTTYYTALQNALSNRTFLVWAAGNQGNDQPTFNAALPTYTDYESFEDIWVTVVATDASGTIADYSNHCGIAKDFCIAAPGTNIYSTLPDNAYGTMSGTSMATPMVSGGLALLVDMFGDSVTAAEITNRLFATANKTGIYSDEDTYGQGFMDLDAATTPVGNASLALSTDTSSGSASLSGSVIETGGALGNSLQNALASVDVMVLDSMDFPFYLNGKSLTTSSTHSNSQQYLNNVMKMSADYELDLNGQGKISTSLTQDENEFTKEKNPSLKSFAMSYNAAENLGFELGYNQNPALSLGLYEDEFINYDLAYLDSSFSNPFLNFQDNSYNISFKTSFANNEIKFLFFNHNDDGSNSYYENAVQDDIISNGFVSELKTPFLLNNKKAMFAFELGALEEENGFLGTKARGAFATDKNSHTYFTGVNFATEFDNNYGLAASFYNGFTNLGVSESSLIKDISTLTSQSLSFGITKKGLFNKNDKITAFANQPLAITNGDAELSLPIKRTYDKSIINQNLSANLAPENKQITLGLNYNLIENDNNSLSLGLGHSFNLNHNGDKEEDFGVLAIKFNF